MRKYYFWVIVFVVVIFGGTFALHTLKNSIMAKAYGDRETRPVISTTPVQSKTYQPSLSSVGSLTAVQGVDVTSQVSGQIINIPFNSGQDVKKGDVLVKLDDRVAYHTYQVDLATLAYDKVNFERQEELLQTNATNKNARDQAKATYLAQKASTDKDEVTLGYMTIHAPFAGRLGIRQVDVGQYITSSTTLVSLQQLNPMYVDFSMAGSTIASLYVDQPVTVAVSSQPEKTFSGKISAIESSVDVATRTINVRADIANKNDLLVPGQFANVTIHLPDQKKVLEIPRTAVTYSLYGDAVFLVTEKKDTNGKAQYIATQEYITLGDVDGENVIVTKGLKAGEKVVNSGQNKVTSGEEVLVNNEIKLD